MNYKQLLVDLRDALNGVAQPTVQVDALRSYLDKWEQNASATAKIDEAVHHRQLEEWKAQLAASSAWGMEMFKAVIEAGQTALKSSIAINGGAAAALLALLAESLKTNGGSGMGALLSPLGYAWFCFMLGLGSAGAATAVRYLSQALYGNAMKVGESNGGTFYRRGNWARNAAALLGFSSYVLFFFGAAKIFVIMQIAGR